jgi:hypothetical protein
VIDFEDAADEFLNIHRNLQDSVKDFVKDIFNATDVNLLRLQIMSSLMKMASLNIMR